MRAPHLQPRPRKGIAAAGVAVGGACAAAALTRYRRRAAREARRMQVLADLATAAHGGLAVDALAQAIADLLVPRVVDLCLIDVTGGGGEPRRLAAALRGGPDLLAELRHRPPRSIPGATVHLPTAADVRDRLARDEDDLHLLRRLSIRSAVVVPLIAREHAFGALTLATRPGRPRIETAGDVEYVETLAGRVALAVDNAVLSDELSTTELRLQTILATVDAAITVRDVHGRMVYANQAAADLLKLPGPEAVKAEAPGALMDRFDVYTEEGEPVALGDLPGTRLLAGEAAPAPVVVRNVVKATGEERWLLNKATAIAAPDGRVLMAVNLVEDVTETKRGEIAQRLLARAAREAAESTDLPRALLAIAEAAVPGLADWAGVDVVDAAGRIAPVAIAHRDPEKVGLGWRLRRTWPVDPDEPEGIGAVIRTGRAQLMHEITDDMLAAGARDAEHLEVLRAVGLTSTMIVPVRAGRRILGALTFVSSTSRRFDERDLELACDLGRQTGVFLNNAQLHAEQAHVARTLQEGLIPGRLPRLDGWRVCTAYRAAGRAHAVGGDFYDVVQFAGGWAALVGDVVGKGAEAAALTALARHTLAAIVESTGDAGHALRVLNRRLRERGGEKSLCTIAVVAVTGDQAAVYAAGHPLPLLVRDGAARPVGRPGMMLGVRDAVDVTPTAIELEPGDQLLLYTEGVLDAVGPDDRFGERRLLRAVEDAAVAASANPAESLIAVVDGFRAGEQADDIAIVSLARLGVAAADQRSTMATTP